MKVIASAIQLWCLGLASTAVSASGSRYLNTLASSPHPGEEGRIMDNEAPTLFLVSPTLSSLPSSHCETNDDDDDGEGTNSISGKETEVEKGQPLTVQLSRAIPLDDFSLFKAHSWSRKLQGRSREGGQPTGQKRLCLTPPRRGLGKAGRGSLSNACLMQLGSSILDEEEALPRPIVLAKLNKGLGKKGLRRVTFSLSEGGETASQSNAGDSSFNFKDIFAELDRIEHK